MCEIFQRKKYSKIKSVLDPKVRYIAGSEYFPVFNFIFLCFRKCSICYNLLVISCYNSCCRMLAHSALTALSAREAVLLSARAVSSKYPKPKPRHYRRRLFEVFIYLFCRRELLSQ